MIKRADVEFEVDGGVKLRGWLFVPPGDGLLPAITMAHGYAGVKEHALEPYARAFAEAGFVVLLHDHRGFGASEGTPRHDIDPPSAESHRRPDGRRTGCGRHRNRAQRRA